MMQKATKPRPSGGGSARRRQDPVSCRLCRVKKLKCNRQYPCSNCVTRGATCEFEPGQLGSTAIARTSQGPAEGDEPSNATILAKLQRLEDLLLRSGQNASSVLPNTPDSSSTTNPGVSGIQVHPDHHGPNVARSSFAEAEESQRREAQTLTNVGIMDKSIVGLSS